jgi:hypothetical protein
MQSSHQYTNPKFLFLFSPNATMYTQGLKFVYNACAGLTLLYIASFLSNFIGLMSNDEVTIKNILYLIFYGLCFPVFILGIICTLSRQSPDTSFKVLVAMQITFIIDMILTIIYFCLMLYILVCDFFDSVYVVISLIYLSHIVPVGFATLFFYFYFKRTVTEGDMNTVSDFTRDAYNPPSCTN